MPTVQLPDGSTVQFPDGMPTDQINSAIKTYLAGRASGPSAPALPAQAAASAALPSGGTTFPRALGLAGAGLLRGALRGVAGVGDMLGEAGNDLDNPFPAPDGPGYTSGANALTAGLGPSPRSPAEHYISAGAEGAGGALPFLPFGGMSPALQVATGAGGGAAGEALREAGGGPGMQTAAGAGVGLAAQGVRALMAGTSLGKIAAALGSAQTWEQAGDALQSRIKQYLSSDMPAAEDAIWSPVDAKLRAAVPGAPAGGTIQTPGGGGVPAPGGSVSPPASAIPPSGLGSSGPITPVDNFYSALKSLNNKYGILQPAATFQANTIPRMQAGMDSSLHSIGVNPTWDDVRAFRSGLGDSIWGGRNNPAFAGYNDADKEFLYKAITKDLEETADANGAGDEFKAANSATSALRSHAEQYLEPLVADGVSPGGATTIALRGAAKDGTRLAALQSVAPDEVGELASAHLLQTPQGWARLSPEAQAALVPDAGTRAKIASLAQMAQSTHPSLASQGQRALNMLTGGLVGELAEHALTGAAQGALGHTLGALAVPVGGAVIGAVPGVVGNLARNPLLPMVGALGGAGAGSDQGQ